MSSQTQAQTQIRIRYCVTVTNGGAIDEVAVLADGKEVARGVFGYGDPNQAVGEACQEYDLRNAPDYVLRYAILVLIDEVVR